MSQQWAPGDRVEVCLPDRGIRPGGRRWHWFTGTVRDIDTGARPGVRVDLDQMVNGVSDCYATHQELRRVPDKTAKPADPLAEFFADKEGSGKP